MIKDFIRQTNASIVNFMLNMNKRKRTYAAHVKGLEPFGEKTHLYLYATKHELVVVCLDDGGRQLDELADEETFCDEQPLYFNADGNRVSPVYHLKAVMRQLYSRLTADYGRLRPQIWGILLTSSRLINRPDMTDTWFGMRISVFDQQDGLQRLRHLPLNDSDQLAGAPYLAHLKPYFAVDDDDAPSDEFERMLNEFIASEYDATFGQNDNVNENDNVNDDNNDADDADIDELTSGFGELELNPNNIVKVEVLQPMRHPEREMQRIVGCQAVKRHIDELIMLNQYNVRMHLLNPEAKPHELSLHSIFLGRPGTGKTTVCKIMGSLLHQAGMLSRGHVVVANRGTFVGSNWGDEERAVRRVVEMARGGVLMIDEAYLLNGDNRNDPGRMVLPMLMDILSDERQRDLAIVLCGYKQQMLRLLELNPGLESRFPNRFEFEDFTVDELLDITQRRIADHGYSFTPQAWDDYTHLIAEAHRSRDPQTWGNARFVANQLERIYLCHAQRCISADINDREQLFQLTPADIQPIQVARPKPRMGF